MPQTTVHKLGAPRKLTGEANTWDVLWVLQVNETIHKVSMKRRLSQKLVVKHNGKPLLDKAFPLYNLYEGYCFVAWTSEGVHFGIHANTPMWCVRTNASHYDLRVNGVKFMDLPDGCKLRQTQRQIALRRSASAPNMTTTSKAPASADGPPGGSKGGTNKNNKNEDSTSTSRGGGRGRLLAKAKTLSRLCA